MEERSKVIIIDSGINAEHSKTNSMHIPYGKSFCSDKDEIEGDIKDRLGHGTAVSSIIHSINPNNEYYILKIYDSELVAEEETLIDALTYLKQINMRSSIIHMSLGVSYFSNQLYNICKELYEQGNLLVAAFDNSGSISYPAAFEFVIGVEASNACTTGTDFLIPMDEMVDVYAKGGIHRVAGIDQAYSIRQGNSISAAYVTGHISKYHTFNKDEALNVLNNMSTYKQLSFHYETNTVQQKDEIDFSSRKVGLFPYNKEITSIVRFADMLPFTIQGVYSNKYFGNVGKEIKSFDHQFTYTIRNIDDLDFHEIDTLVIGHLTELEQMKKINLKETILRRCLEHGVNAFSLDSFGISEFYYEEFKKKGLRLDTPKIHVQSGKKKIGKLHRIQTPVLGVFGTSSKQGKFTLQLLLRRLFKRHGYEIAQISTEPTGILFGIDETIPFGYNSMNKLSEYEFINYVNTSLNRLDRGNPDLIMVGSQSATVTQSFNHLGHLAIKQIEFLIGSMPDAVILCINPNDDITYIQRTMSTIENIVPTRIIAVAIYPFVYKNGWHLHNGNMIQLDAEQIERLKNKLHNHIKVPIYSIDNEDDINSLFDVIIEQFS